MSGALIIVDVQNDFTEGGALGVEGGAAVAAGISEHLRSNRGRYTLIVASQDWHDGDNDNGGHFAVGAAPDFVNTWPRHCVAGTDGAALHPSLETDALDVLVRKGQGVPAYSAFEGTTSDGRTLGRVLADAGVDTIDVAGIATDYCVRATALDALHAGLVVRVLADLTAGVASDSSAAAVDEIRGAGGTIVVG